MSEKKHIDRLFQEKFKDFNVKPDDAVWDRINSSLNEKKKKRRVLPLWLQIGGIAASLVLLITISNALFNSNPNVDTPIVDTENIENVDSNKIVFPSKTTNNTTKDSNIEVAEINSSTINTSENNSSTVAQKSQHSKALVSNGLEKKDNNNPSHQNTISNTLANQKVLVNNNIKTSAKVSEAQKQLNDNIELRSQIETVVNNQNTTVANTQNTDGSKNEDTSSESKPLEELPNSDDITKKPFIEDALAEQNKPIIEEEKEKQNRWSVVANAAPVYFGSLGEGSSINSQFNNNPKSGAINMSYGVTGKYTVSKRLKIRAGINNVNLNQTTSDVLVFSGDEGLISRNFMSQDNIRLNENVSSISLMSGSTLSQSATVPEVFNSKIPGNLDQRFGFIEVPLELEYSLVDKKFGVNLIGGFSTLFLNRNDIYADVDGISTLIGEANNINSTSFTANFGLGLDYKLSKQWHINLEPQFKYQINTFNNISGDFRPFFIGVYSGLSFKF